MRICYLTIMLSAIAFNGIAEDLSYRTPQQILDASPAADWYQPLPENTLYMELEQGRVIIELAPKFAPQHVENIQTLANAHFWDGLSIYRSQDNFVVQFGDPNADKPEQAKSLNPAKLYLPAEFERSSNNLEFTTLPDNDGWADNVGFVEGFPVGHDTRTNTSWIAHCYGVLGAGRSNEPDSSIGAELYVVTGQSPRQLDRNITTVGYVLHGMELLSSLPRGKGPLGFYNESEQTTPIISIRLASDIPVSQRTIIERLNTKSLTFQRVVEARRNRRDSFYKRPAGHIDLCNVPLPVRIVGQ